MPRVTLVGKGVCFDTGGLDIKPPSNMMTMKKDMGGAAAVLSLASMIMEARINVQLRVLVPAVENCVESCVEVRAAQKVRAPAPSPSGRAPLA